MAKSTSGSVAHRTSSAIRYSGLAGSRPDGPSRWNLRRSTHRSISLADSHCRQCTCKVSRVLRIITPTAAAATTINGKAAIAMLAAAPSLRSSALKNQPCQPFIRTFTPTLTRIMLASARVQNHAFGAVDPDHQPRERPMKERAASRSAESRCRASVPGADPGAGGASLICQGPGSQAGPASPQGGRGGPQVARSRHTWNVSRQIRMCTLFLVTQL